MASAPLPAATALRPSPAAHGGAALVDGGSLAAGSPPLAALAPVPGLRVTLSPLLVLGEAAPSDGEAAGAAAQQTRPKPEAAGPAAAAAGAAAAGSSEPALGPPAVAAGPTAVAAAAAALPRPGMLERAYWDWRRHDLKQVDAAFLAFSASQALLMASREGAGSRGATALMLCACAVQLASLLAPRRTYAGARVPLIVAVRALYSASGWLSQRALAARLEAGALVAASGGARASALQAVLAATAVGRLVLVPLGLQLPFRLALPLQVADYALAAVGSAASVRHVTHFLEASGPQLGGALHLLHDTLDGLFHVSTALLFPGAYDIPLACSASAIELLVLFLQLLAGCLLPLYAAYATELASKVRFVQRWASRHGFGLRGTELLASPGGGSGSGSGAGSGSAADGGSCDGDGSSSRSGGSWRSRSSRGEHGMVYLGLSGPVTLLELDCVAEGRAVATYTHAAWLLLLTVVGWGLTAQLHHIGAGGGRQQSPAA